MPDPKFHKKTEARTLGQLAELSGSRLHENSDKGFTVKDVAPLEQARAFEISFLDNIKYKDSFAKTQAGACVIHEKMLGDAPAGVHLLISSNPYKSYALIAQAFYPEEFPQTNISEQAHVHPDAVIGQGCVIDDGAVVGAGAQIGDGCWVEPNAVIGADCVIGKKCRIGANTSVSHALIGDYVRLYPGVRVGQDGFGFAIDPAGHIKVPQLGRVVIEDHVEVGANTAIDRGAGPDTVIGAGTWIDNLVQIGHNAKIGRGCVIVGQAGVAGSTVIGDYVVIAAQVGVAGHLHVGQGARIGAQSGVMRDVEPGEELIGTPAVPAKQFMRQVTALKRLTKTQKSE